MEQGQLECGKPAATASFESVILKSKFVCMYVCVCAYIDQGHTGAHAHTCVGATGCSGAFDGLNEMPPCSEYSVLSWWLFGEDEESGLARGSISLGTGFEVSKKQLF